VMVRYRRGQELTGVERDMIARIPQTGHDLLAHIPRLEGVAEAVLYACKDYNDKGTVAGDAIPESARLLRICSDFVDLESGGKSARQALEGLREAGAVYDAKLLARIADVLCPAPVEGEDSKGALSIAFADLHVGDVLVSSIETITGVMIVNAGALVSPAVLERLRNFAKLNPFKEPIAVSRWTPVTASKVGAE
jgi:hypothetical protein